MRRGRWAQDPEALRRSARDGVIAAASLRGLGVPGPTIARRCQDGGRWRRLLPGIVLLGTGPPTRRQRLSAALLYGGPHTIVTGLEACRRHGVRRGPDPNGYVHLLVPHDRQLRTSVFVVVERTTRLPRPQVRDNVPLSPLELMERDLERAIADEAYERAAELRDAIRQLSRAHLDGSVDHGA